MTNFSNVCNHETGLLDTVSKVDTIAECQDLKDFKKLAAAAQDQPNKKQRRGFRYGSEKEEGRTPLP